VLVASSAPLDQFVVRNPAYFFDASPEHALINPDNLHILVDHVKCAAFELPFTTSEQYGRHDVQEVLGILEESGLVHRIDDALGGPGHWQWTNESYPADALSLRSISSDNFVVVDVSDGAAVIGETSFTSGPSTLHEKAIYIVEAALYQVEKLDFEGRKAYVRRIDCDYYTDAITYTKVTILDTFAGGADRPKALGPRPKEEHDGTDGGDFVPGERFDPDPSDNLVLGPFASGLTAAAFHGEVHVVSRVVGFKKIKFYTNENVGSGELDLPEQQMHTTSYWLRLSPEIMASIPFGNADRRDGVVGLAHAMRNVAPLLLMCDSHDLGLSVDGLAVEGASRMGGSARGASRAEISVEPTIFIYDNYPGGIGFSEPLHGLHDVLIARTRELIDECACESGCPSCVGPEGATGPLAKAVASRLLERLMAARAAA
jgi:DEAD/DEAH box helicase domain-containing protein